MSSRPSRIINERSAEILDQFGLSADANRKVMDLSGGFKRHVQVAKVFMVDTPVVFLDEFSTGMDPLLKRSVMNRIREEAARGRTMVLTTQLIAMGQAVVTILLARWLLGVAIMWNRLPLLAAAVFVGTAGWFFFYAVFALMIRRNDAFNTVTSVFYFVFLFASSMFYPIEPRPAVFRHVAPLNPITWHVDVMRFATIGLGHGSVIAVQAAAFVVFSATASAGALWALRRQ